MSCECCECSYDCCEVPYTWDDLAGDVAASFDAQASLFDRVVREHLLGRVRPYAPKWWVPFLPDFSHEWSISVENDYEEFNNWGGRYAESALSDSRITLTYRDESIRIDEYCWHIEDGRGVLDAVFSVEPPPWGWWMPSLR